MLAGIYANKIGCINPSDSYIEENMSTLEYASKASQISIRPVVKIDPKSKYILDLKV